ncbi:Clavaminate synthase-like protein [Ganoderma leucocontextum]|nr:Clavaminate synthase-like protein [Ganoderma leucocontextum]
MPGTTLPSVPHYVPPPPTKENLDWADLPIIDFSKAGTPEGRAELAPQVRDAMRVHGFLIIVNHGWTQAQNQRIFDLADVPFSQVSEDEKKRFQTKTHVTGTAEGYKLRRLWTIDNGVRDELEYYTFFGQADHPKVLQPFLQDYQQFARHNHFNLLHPILRLLALGMELPEETFVNIHDFNDTAVKYARFLKYYPRTEEDEAKSKNVWLKGHTDIGTITILWSQPVSALQVMSPDGKWRWVRHINNALVVNVGDAMEMLTGGFYKATIHRVVQPPRDQRGCTRLGAFYFAMCNDDVTLVPFTASPALQRVGVVRKIDDEDAPTMREWRKGRAKAYGLTELKRKDDVVEEQVINGVVVKHYN